MQLTIPRYEIPTITRAILSLVDTYGHPKDFPLGQLAARGVLPDAAQTCEDILRQLGEELTADKDQAVKQWILAITRHAV